MNFFKQHIDSVSWKTPTLDEKPLLRRLNACDVRSHIWKDEWERRTAEKVGEKRRLVCICGNNKRVSWFEGERIIRCTQHSISIPISNRSILYSDVWTHLRFKMANYIFAGYFPSWHGVFLECSSDSYRMVWHRSKLFFDDQNSIVWRCFL